METLITKAILDMMRKGASPMAVASQLPIEVTDIENHSVQDPKFAAELQRVREQLAENVVSKLYQTAMMGNVSAALGFLKLFPPRDWTGRRAEEEMEAFFSEKSDSELVEIAKQLGVSLEELEDEQEDLELQTGTDFGLQPMGGEEPRHDPPSLGGTPDRDQSSEAVPGGSEWQDFVD